MKKVNIMSEVLKSWKRCAQNHEPVENHMPPVIHKESLEGICHTHHVFIQAYHKALKVMGEAINKTIFITDDQGVLLKHTQALKMDWLRAGVSFAEKDMGTNAVSVCLHVKQPAYLIPEYHYCQCMKSLYGYACPLNIKKKYFVWQSFLSIVQYPKNTGY